MTLDLVARLRAAGCVFAEEEAALLVASPRFSEDLVERRISGEPLEYVLGWAAFMDARYLIEPGVFIPRHRTEFLVRSAAAGAPESPVLLDLCCGTGALGLSLHSLTGGTLVATDIDPAAVRCARANGADAYTGDLFDAVPSSLRGRVDVLLANTPYVPTAAIAFLPGEFREHEARAALDGGSDGLDLQRRVAAAASTWLAPGGVIYVEASEEQAPVSAALFEATGLSVRILADEDTTIVAARSSPHR